MTQSIQGAIDYLQTQMLTLTARAMNDTTVIKVESAPTDLPEAKMQFPFALTYVGKGEFVQNASDFADDIVTLYCELHLARGLLGPAVHAAYQFHAAFEKMIMADPTLNGNVSTIVGRIPYTFGWLKWGASDVKEHIGFRWEILCKIQIVVEPTTEIAPAENVQTVYEYSGPDGMTLDDATQVVIVNLPDTGAKTIILPYAKNVAMNHSITILRRDKYGGTLYINHQSGDSMQRYFLGNAAQKYAMTKSGDMIQCRSNGVDTWTLCGGGTIQAPLITTVGDQASVQLNPSQEIVWAYLTSGLDVVITLPYDDSGNLGQRFTIVRADNTANTLTIQADAGNGDSLNGVVGGSISLNTQWKRAEIVLAYLANWSAVII